MRPKAEVEYRRTLCEIAWNLLIQVGRHSAEQYCFSIPNYRSNWIQLKRRNIKSPWNLRKRILHQTYKHTVKYVMCRKDSELLHLQKVSFQRGICRQLLHLCSKFAEGKLPSC